MKKSNFILKLYNENITFPQAGLNNRQGGILIFGMKIYRDRGLERWGDGVMGRIIWSLILPCPPSLVTFSPTRPLIACQ
ncbi:hypothetical protein CBP28_06945 [Fischerella thermalis WC559]|jgi:hypothetical protein|nr:hypothetical protein CBP18_05125 [Fischerella thermalis WC119]PLZ14261.1 hypothetical protein CBP17_04580 [Fischerella thermalis WC114]PLZ19070.1 hypothetical protein CBP30_15275 [Fischerella thermalis WC157]PLZ25257.1 hypothetical protein CBP29_08985 [Fischerella thermalis WC341]PLZ31184.1 hypothetical protein CBP28_06945 [Fischerella thermalis WC559]PLZ46059.1 hypothetical protein CBP15_22490 [Fischerella thermalis WC442]PLZ50161.1 hypothetical protein CBP13_15565 [Fischerella thermalis 